MGVKDLWSILTPFCERKPLYELQGKNVAIDLSGWVCQAQCITEYQVQPRMYLRNLYFRTSYLLLQGVTPVFVLEGEAPTLKHKTITARNAIQFKGAKPRAEGDAPPKHTKGRTRFHHTLKQCEEMLRIMGLACVTGHGEAEAMCAYLNEEGMVEGCISQDSDCFAYGARVVYRNFSISQQGAHAASGGSVDVYDIRKATKATGFGRNKVVALALLCGSDYNDGVFGVGKDSVLKLFACVEDEDILQLMKDWRDKKDLYIEMERQFDGKQTCAQCGHAGKKLSHAKNGCLQCGTKQGCDFSKNNDQRAAIKNEINIRAKALEDENFPSEELINEFLVRKDKVTNLDLRWKRPDMKKFVKFTTKYLQWEELYCYEKFFPILTRWLVIHSDCKDDKLDPKPSHIKKIRNPKGIPCYEIVWDCDVFKNVIPETQLESIDTVKLNSTIEPQNYVDTAYPDLVSCFKQSKIKPKRNPKKQVNTINKYMKDHSFFGDEDDEYDLTSIVDEIVCRGLPEAVRNKLHVIVGDIKRDDEANTSSFFMHNATDVDLFETTFNKLDSSDDENELDHDNDECSGPSPEKVVKLDDSFDVICIPLRDRLKSKNC